MGEIIMIIQPDKIFSVDELLSKELLDKENVSSSFYRLKSSKGIYILFGEANEVLYIGWATDLKGRIMNHISGNSNTKYFVNEIKNVGVISERSFDKIWSEHPECYDIEYFMIEEIKPKYNKMRGRCVAYEKTKHLRRKKDEYSQDDINDAYDMVVF
jgi:excinuclease UvrABC nuclease subunit